MPGVRSNGEVMGIQPERGLFKLSDIEHKREYLRRTKLTPIRSRKPSFPHVGDDPIEQRAAKVAGSILERIVYKKLTELLGPEGSAWLYKHGVNGARMYQGGYEMDFLIQRGTPLDLEVQGEHWHTATTHWKDTARALYMVGSGFDYAEILEWEISGSDQYLEFRLRQILGL